MSKAGAARPPFFVVGCVRSGTTLLRDILKSHPELACPEETHFFRWAAPFGTREFLRPYLRGAALKRHRAIDGISDTEFEELASGATNRREMMERYMALYIARNKPRASRWFDKTPQNVYGAALIWEAFPESKLVHIVRDPVDVVASLRIGRVMKVEDLVGACNYWTEAVTIINLIKRLDPARVLELKYEAFTAAPESWTARVLEFVGEPERTSSYPYERVKPKTHREDAVLSAGEVEAVRRHCERWARHYGYLPADAPVA